MNKGVENYIFWSEIGSGFGEPGGAHPPRILRSSTSWILQKSVSLFQGSRLFHRGDGAKRYEVRPEVRWREKKKMKRGENTPYPNSPPPAPSLFFSVHISSPRFVSIQSHSTLPVAHAFRRDRSFFIA